PVSLPRHLLLAPALDDILRRPLWYLPVARLSLPALEGLLGDFASACHRIEQAPLRLRLPRHTRTLPADLASATVSEREVAPEALRWVAAGLAPVRPAHQRLAAPQQWPSAVPAGP